MQRMLHCRCHLGTLVVCNAAYFEAQRAKRRSEKIQTTPMNVICNFKLIAIVAYAGTALAQ
jgi:hypothetical protein